MNLDDFPADTVVEIGPALGAGIQQLLIMTQADGTAYFMANSDCRNEPPTFTVRGKGFATAATVDPVAAGAC